LSELGKEINRHLAYSYLLNECLTVRVPNPDYTCDCRKRGSHHSVDRCLHDITTPYLTEQDARAIKEYWNPSAHEMRLLRSIPTDIQKSIFAAEMGRKFNLLRVPGFYFDECYRMFLPYKQGIIKPYFNGTDYIQGLLIYPHVKATPKLFESIGLVYGARAVPFIPDLERAA
jgi:hypothetical protein